MGIYLNPGKSHFEIAINSQIYVDKTEIIDYLNTVVNTEQRFLCVSRPRRFGKTMTMDMLCAYYGIGADSRELFATRKLGQCPDWDKYLGKFDIISITMTRFIRGNQSLAACLGKLVRRVFDDLTEAYPEVALDPDDLLYSLEKVWRTTGRKFVFLIDEWDVVFRQFKHDYTAQRQYLDYLRDWFKDQPCIAMAYMTGILPVKKYGHQSALNMFDEYSMIDPLQLAPYTGFTADEVRELCREYGMDYHEVAAWYDGYVVTDESPADAAFRASKDPNKVRPQPNEYHLYAPLSVVKVMLTGKFNNFWNNTETYEALAEYIRMDFVGLKEIVARLMAGEHIPVDLSTYSNDMTTISRRDDVLALLVHLGYLGYTKYRNVWKPGQPHGEVFMPNREVLQVYNTCMIASPEWSSTMRALKNSQELLEATWAGDAKRVAELVEEAHDKAGNRTYSSEAALSYAVQLAYYKAQDYYTLLPEVDSGKGYVDLMYLPKDQAHPALLVELKYEQCPETAIDQILRKDYPSRLEHYAGNLILVGISYDKEVGAKAPNYKHHSCRLLRA